MRTKAFFNLYSIQFFYSLGHIFAFSLLFLYLSNIGFSAVEIAVFSTLQFVSSSFVLVFIRAVRFSKIETTSILSKAAYLAFFAAFVPGIELIQLYFIALVSGVVMFTFWVPYNIRFFRFGNKENNAFMGSAIYLLWPILNIFLPASAGLLAHEIGFVAVFLISAALVLPALLFIGRCGEDEYFHFDIKKSLGNTKGIRTLVLLEGISQGALWTAVPLATISYLASEIDYGLFFSYLGFFGAIASVVLARMSDRTKRRTVFIYPVAAVMGMSMIAAGFASTLVVWATAIASVTFFSNLLSPFQIAVVLDKSKDLMDSMATRELFLNTGRTLGGISAISSIVLFGQSEHALAVGGASVILYALILHTKKLYPHRSLSA